MNFGPLFSALFKVFILILAGYFLNRRKILDARVNAGLSALIVYLTEVVLLGISPYSRTVWIAENLTGLIPAAGLCLLYWKGVRFSNAAYTLVALYFILHTVGGYYTFERVPFGFITDLFGFERNHYDRVCHFLVGTFAFMTLEYIERTRLMRSRAAAVFFTVMSIFGFAAVFELIEWIYAVLANPEAGSAFLGSQGDIWDAQKDMLSDGLGAIVCSALYVLMRRPPKDS